jgi:ABC-2 type transport system permease protein
MGGTFLALGAFISSLTRNQIVAGAVTFGLFLMLYVLDWVNAYSTSTVGKICKYLAIAPHFQQFSKGVIELKDTIYYVSAIGFGLFLTKRSLESLRWRS